jgi:trigger factor
MNVTVESTGALERKMRVELPAERIEKEIETRLKTVGRTAKIKGFRPGKIPAKVVRQRYGGQVRQEVLSDLMGQSYRDAVQQENLNPVAQPRIEPEFSEDTNDFAFVATFEVLPEVVLKDLDKIEVTRPEVEISDEDEEEMLLNLRKQKANWVETDRASAVGDRVIVDFEGKLKGETFDGGTGKEVPVTLGQGQMLPDFEKALYKMKAGDEKSFKVKFPEDYHAEELAKKKVDFSVTVQRVEEEELPPLDDSLAETYGVAEGGLEQLRKDVRSNMQREAKTKIANDVKDQVMNTLLEFNPLEVPNALKYQEMHNLQHQAMQQLGVEDHSQAPPVENFAESAERRVRLGLLINQLVAENEIMVDAERVRQRVEEMCAGYENSEEMVNMYLGNQQVMESIQPMVLEEQAVDLLMEAGSEKSSKVSFKEYMKP